VGRLLEETEALVTSLDGPDETDLRYPRRWRP